MAYHRDPEVDSFCVQTVKTLEAVAECRRAYDALHLLPQDHGVETPTQLAEEELKLYGRLTRALLLLDGSMPDLLSAAMKISTDLYKSLGYPWIGLGANRAKAGGSS